MKTWKPDTCECEVEEIYSGTTIIGGGQVLKKCVAHISVADGDLYGVLYDNPDGENKRKNQMLRILLGHEGINLNLQQTKINPDGSNLIELKDGISYNWSWTGVGKDRVLNVIISGANLTTNQKNSIRTLCNTKYGTGKVEIL